MSEIVNYCEELQLANSGTASEEPEADPTAEPKLPMVYLPADGRNTSDFASQDGRIMGPKKRWFLKGDMAVEVREAQITKDGRTNVYHPLAAAEVITAIEDHLLTGRGAKGEDGDVMFVRKSMSREIATALLASPQFKRQLPRIDRILDVPVPYLQERVLLFANTGYDERLNTFCPAVHLGITPLGLEKSKELLRELFQDFCFANRDSATIAIARLITPMCRGLMGWSAHPYSSSKATDPEQERIIWLAARAFYTRDMLTKMHPLTRNGKKPSNASVQPCPPAVGSCISPTAKAILITLVLSRHLQPRCLIVEN